MSSQETCPNKSRSIELRCPDVQVAMPVLYLPLNGYQPITALSSGLSTTQVSQVLLFRNGASVIGGIGVWYGGYEGKTYLVDVSHLLAHFHDAVKTIIGHKCAPVVKRPNLEHARNNERWILVQIKRLPVGIPEARRWQSLYTFLLSHATKLVTFAEITKKPWKNNQRFIQMWHKNLQKQII